jgi:sporulation integral membrane protein YtvI
MQPLERKEQKMVHSFLKKTLPFVVVALLLWLGLRYLLPVALPFLLGAGIALLAEPAVRALTRKLPRWGATAVCVTVTLGLLAGTVSLVGAVAIRQIGKLAQGMPEMAQTAKQGLIAVRDWLSKLGQQAPDAIRPALERTVTEFFSDGNGLVEQVTQRIPGVVTGAIGRVGSGALGLGTAVVAAYLISARLPHLKQAVSTCLPAGWYEKTLPALRRVRMALGGWLKAQLKLCAVTWGIVSVGFLLMGIKNGMLWALLVAVVDAVPILGTGTVLVPWAAMCLIKKESLRAIGLLCTYGASAMTRTVLEPRLMGKQLGLDPLTTLLALYAGYRFWGITGLLLTPILASAAKSIFQAKPLPDAGS